MEPVPSQICRRCNDEFLAGYSGGLLGKFFQSLQNISGKRPAIVSDTDLCETDGRAAIDDKGGRIRRFLRGIPTQPVRIRENVIGIGGDAEGRWQRSTCEELSGVLLH